MEHDEQRRVALRLAKDAGATNTLAAIKDQDSCYADILTAAATEIGLGALVAHVLEGDPEWAYNTLRSVPDLGAHRGPLLLKAAETPEVAVHTLRFVADLGEHRQTIVAKAGALGTSLGNISAMSLKDQGGFNCTFTIEWTNAGVNQPGTGQPDNSKWIWSEKLLLGKSTKMQCLAFALPDIPLEPGNEVWMYVSVQAGTDNTSPLHFTYDPNVTTTADFTISGTTTSNKLGFNQFS